MTLVWFARMKKRLKRLAAEQPDYFAREVFGDDWQCPYCGRLAVRELDASTRWAQMEEHLRGCGRAQGLSGRLMRLPELDHRAQRHRMARTLACDPAWRVRGPRGAWVCPYCTKETDTVCRRGPEFVDGVMAHMPNCKAYGAGRPALAAGALKRVLRERARHRVQLERVIARIKRHPVLRFHDANGRWICPFCERSLVDVDMSSAFLAEKVMPERAARHMLSDACRAIEMQFTVTRTPDQMRALAAAIDREIEAGAIPKKPRTTDEIAAVRDDATARTDTDVLRRDRAAAAQAQARMRPREVPQVPGYRVGYLVRPAGDLCSDFLDIQALGSKWLAITLGSVSGGGLAGGLVMSMARKAFSLRAMDGNRPRTVLAKVNRDIAPDLQPESFLTAVYGILDAEAHTFTFARAGHRAPLTADRDNLALEVLSQGMSLGLVSDDRFREALEERALPMPPGGWCLLYTDGLVEARGADGLAFGAERLAFTVNTLRSAPDEGAFLKGVLDAAASHTGGAFDDDITLIAIRRLPD